MIDRLAHLSALGVSAVGMAMPGGARSEWCDQVERFGTEVIAKLG